MSTQESAERPHSWRDEMPSFDQAVPYATRQLMHTVLNSPFPEINKSTKHLVRQAFFVDFAGNYELEEFCADILILSASNNRWASVPQVSLDKQKEKQTSEYNIQQEALKLGLIDRVPAGQEDRGYPEYHPTKLLIDGVTARLQGKMDVRVVNSTAQPK